MKPRGWIASPGKLMLAGEYSVLRPGGLALAVAVDSGIRIRLEAAESDLLTSPGLALEKVPLSEDGPGRFVWSALHLCRQWLPQPGFWHVFVEGGIRLGGEKVGLGDSAAVVSGLVRAWSLLAKHSDPEERWGLSVALEAHYRASGNRGSGYDVATSFEGGTVLYGPPDGLTQLSSGSEVTWTPARLEQLSWPDGLYWGCGFCGRGVSTRRLVDALASQEVEEMMAMARAAQSCIEAFIGGEIPFILENLLALDPLLDTWSTRAGVALFTPAMKEMREIALLHGAVPRVSGAGGGDSLLVFSDQEDVVEQVQLAWEAAGYPRLPLVAMGLRAG